MVENTGTPWQVSCRVIVRGGSFRHGPRMAATRSVEVAPSCDVQLIVATVGIFCDLKRIFFPIQPNVLRDRCRARLCDVRGGVGRQDTSHSDLEVIASRRVVVLCAQLVVINERSFSASYTPVAARSVTVHHDDRQCPSIALRR